MDKKVDLKINIAMVIGLILLYIPLFFVTLVGMNLDGMGYYCSLIDIQCILSRRPDDFTIYAFLYTFNLLFIAFIFIYMYKIKKLIKDNTKEKIDG